MNGCVKPNNFLFIKQYFRNKRQLMNRRAFLKFSLGTGVFALAGSYPILIERNLLQVNHYKIYLSNLPRNFDGFTIAHLTDLHLGTLVSESFISGVIQKTNELKTDVIVCTGDYVHERNTTQEIDKVWPLLSKLRARHGVFSVLGNHDHWADTERSLNWLNRTGQNIRHRCAAVYQGNERIVFGGAGDLWEDDLNIDKAFAEFPGDECRILLSHNPDSVDQRFNTEISLVISGHTHGGQVVLPFYGPPVLPVKNKKYSSGVIAAKNTKLFISRGIGWAIYPIRFNCYPELAVLQLIVPKNNADINV